MPRLSTNWLFLLLCIGSIACRSLPRGPFDSTSVPPVPDYSDPASWAALPTLDDEADVLPADTLVDRQADAPIDVFFLHPTSYTGKRGDRNWNAAVSNEDVNERTDEGAIRFQATIFNGVGKVYAPRYRQGHLHLYYSEDTTSARKALQLAYQDVRRAFQYYWEHYNDGRPVIIAAHSQGTNHAERLLREFFDGQPRQQQLVAAYLVGMPIRKDAFEKIPACETPGQTGCFTSWRTFKRGFEPEKIPHGDQIVATNPLLWSLDDTYAPDSLNVGAVLNPFQRIYPEASDAQNYQGVLWASKPKFKGSLFLTGKNYHIGDYNIYYLNVRENARLRTNKYLNQNNQAISSER
ncbi:DUF3089 domain-containing protein [Flavilitoribacter nigricans]|uniref:DUF3089 domain-containing protein n=1 Tax=Flavilitoribacter nigricans (strain ATCC 23147 / DSM 23189 / NBRC 102662 / NCIMB 1420 / SS-2) TaxID=1122177 RepID=A0A2D0MX83_FLAN2|nr:DUF3089 domain-containing protein [Flavilitoribacter nigricans]PHN00882.1 hypothetical protein CRP01_40040 [Flavilitoribacter nigricans DSM 23189 = NBRC 102662]